MSTGLKENLISYETLKKLGHLDETQFLEPRDTESKSANAYVTKCEESTIYAKDWGEYLCECPRGDPLKEGKAVEQEHKKRMKELDELMEQTNKWLQEGKSEEEIKTLEKEEMVKTFKSTAFNVCENQPLQMLKDTKMEVVIKAGAVPKPTMRPIPCPINLREQAKKKLEQE